MMYGSLNGPYSGPTKPRREQKISFVFRRTDGDQHCAGTNSVAFAADGSSIYTASRDATVKRWKPKGSCYSCESTFEGHVDWVNDIAVIGSLLASCSSDGTIQLWDDNQQGVQRPKASFAQHKDYVTALAAAPQKEVLASAGLQGEVFLWDVAAATVAYVAKGGVHDALAVQGPKGSVYAVDVTPTASLVAAGTTEKVIRIADPRTGNKIMKLRGHTDNIRSVVLNAEGTLLLSGSSDHTIRLWDLGQQRCVHTFVVHTGSVWSLQTSPSFDTVYSGGKDNCVYRTNLVNRKAELLAMESHPVLRVALNGETGDMWVATTSSTINKWKVEPDATASPRLPSATLDNQEEAGTAMPAFMACFNVLQRSRSNFDSGPSPHPTPQQTAPCASIPGIPPLLRSRVLTDRRHVLTEDAEGNVDLWDITTGSVVDNFGKVDFREKEIELFAPMSVSSWVSMNTKLGCLSGQLDPQQCFGAEIYAQDLGIVNAPDDLKLNFGERMLKGLFESWSTSHRRDSDGGEAKDTTMTEAMGDGGGPAQPIPFQFCSSSIPPSVMLRTASNAPWVRVVDHMDGSEGSDIIPQWVQDCVLKEKYPLSKDMKCAFILVPVDGSNLPSLMQSRLNAPRVLRIHKVVSYAISKLAEHNISLAAYPIYTNGQSDPPESSGQALELMCNGVVVPYDMSLAAVKQFIWKKSDDLILHFRIRDPKNPAPLPVIKQPS